MRKINPADVRADFASGLADLLNFYRATRALISSDRDRSVLAESALMGIAVLWEGFVSDLLIAYINRDSAKFAVHLKNALEAPMSSKQKNIYSKYALLTVPTHISRADIVSFLDEYGNNITFRNFAELKSQAKLWLTTANVTQINTRTTAQASVVNALIAIRNHLAHRSNRSLDAMNDALNVGALHGTGLRRGVNRVQHIGGYLKANVPGGNASRLEAIFRQIGAIAAAL